MHSSPARSFLPAPPDNRGSSGSSENCRRAASCPPQRAFGVERGGAAPGEEKASPPTINPAHASRSSIAPDGARTPALRPVVPRPQRGGGSHGDKRCSNRNGVRAPPTARCEPYGRPCSGPACEREHRGISNRCFAGHYRRPVLQRSNVIPECLCREVMSPSRSLPRVAICDGS